MRESLEDALEGAWGGERRCRYAEVEEECVELIAGAGHLGEEGIAFGDEEVEDGGGIIGEDAGKVRAVAEEDLGDGAGIGEVSLVLSASGGAEGGGPAGVAVEDGEAVVEEEAGEWTAEGEGALDGDGRRVGEGEEPVEEAGEGVGRVIAGEGVDELRLGVESDGGEDTLVRIDTDGKQGETPVG